MTPQQFLSNQGVSITSVARAMTKLNQADREIDYYVDVLKQLTGEDFTFDDQKVAKFTFLYFIQNYLRMFNNLDPSLTLESIVENCKTQAQTFIDQHPWLWVTGEESEDDGCPSEFVGSRKKGWKMDKAEELYTQNKSKAKKEILQLFQTKLETSYAGAMSYFTKCCNKFGQCADSDNGSAPNKKTIALELYKSNIDKTKEEIIDILEKQLETTRSGAQTYFYTCRKELGECASNSSVKPKRKITKLQKAQAIYDENPNLSKTELVELFVKELDTTPAGANTYYHKINIKENP